MLANYIKTGFRNLLRDKAYSLINVVGLSVGLASCFMILIYSVHEMSFDRYDKNLDRIYLLTMDFGLSGLKETQPLVPFPVGPTLQSEYPEVEGFARFYSLHSTVTSSGNSARGVSCASADSTIFKILSLHIVSGSLSELAIQKNAAVVSHQLAMRLFNGGDAVGRNIAVSWGDSTYELNVAAVMDDIPSTSTFRADCIIPVYAAGNMIRKNYSHYYEDPLKSWGPGVINTYVLLSNNASAGQLAQKLVAFSKEHPEVPGMPPSSFHIYPLKDVYFRPVSMVNSFFPMGDLADVRIYSAIALLTLLIACVNFVILGTARASVRTKEIGVRKVIGASRVEIARQVMVESLIVSILSFPGAILLVEIFMQRLTFLLGKRIPVDYVHSIDSLALYVSVTLIAGLLSGSYVAFFLSRFQPADILRKKFSVGHDGINLRRGLIAIQMMIFVGLISVSITIYRQMRYFHTKDMGFDPKNLVVFRYWKDRIHPYGYPYDLGEQIIPLQSSLEAIPNVSAVTYGQISPGSMAMQMEEIEDKSEPGRSVVFEIYSVGRNFFEALGMKMVAGKSFAQASPDEYKNAVVINQEAARELRITDPSRQLFRDQRILGVVADFNLHSLHQKIAPTVFRCDNNNPQEIVVRLKHLQGASQTISSVTKEIGGFGSGIHASYQFFDDRLDALYGNDRRFAGMIGYFTGLAVFIACLGIFGMSLFLMQRRVKEIGIRKVLGASGTGLFFSLAKEFVVLLSISTLISFPLSVYFTHSWLQNYAYHINENAWTLLLTFLSGLVVVIVTIGYQTLKAATSNPVESLRYE